MNTNELKEVLELHKKWLNANEDGIHANLTGADLDYSCLPLCCGSLTAQMDDRLVIQLLYHTLSIVQNSKNVSEELKISLLTETNLEIANRFYRVEDCECDELKGVEE